MPAPGVTAVDRVVADLRRGSMAVLRDDARGEVAIVQAAETVRPESMAAMVRLAGSRPALVVTRNRARALSTGAGSAAVQSFSLPVDSNDALVLRLADPTLPVTDGADDPTPSLSIVPEPEIGLAASAIRLAKMARLLPAMIIARVSGVEPARAQAWAIEKRLLLTTVHDVDSYPSASAATLSRSVSARVPLADAEDCRLVAFRPSDGGVEHLALLIGSPDLSQPPLVRLHSQCFTGDLLGSLRCDCGEQLRGAVREIAASGGGILLYLAQEGRDIGLINKLRAYELQDRGFDTVDANEQIGFDDDERVYEPAATMLRQLGATRVRLLTNNPRKIEQLSAHGIEVVERVAHAFPSNDHNVEYLRTKARKSGHLF